VRLSDLRHTAGGVVVSPPLDRRNSKDRHPELDAVRTIGMSRRRMNPDRMARSVIALVIAAAGCKRIEEPGPAAADAAPQAAEPKPDEVYSQSDKEVKPVYPVEVGEPDPRAVRLCRALHREVAEKKAKCCSTASTGDFSAECTRMLTFALREKAVAIEDAKIDACAAAVAAETEGCDWVTPFMPPPPLACRGIIDGALEQGKKCRSSLECKSGLHCRGLGPTEQGVCTAQLAESLPCGSTLDALAVQTRQEGFDDRHGECAGVCQSKRCKAFAKKGEACSTSKECGPGHHCADKKCIEGATIEVGQPCTDDVCGPDARCSGGKCIALKVAGESCTEPFECKAACVMEPGAKSGKCGMKCSAWPPAGYPTPKELAPRKTTSKKPTAPAR
jgi:hypothetical protein